MKPFVEGLVLLTTCLSAGSFYLLAPAIIAEESPRSESITLPPTPQPAPPPPASHPSSADQDDRRRHNTKSQQSGRDSARDKQSITSHDKQLADLARQPRPLKWHMNLSLTYPHAKTFGEWRQDYQVEPGISWHFSHRVSSAMTEGSTTTWLGWRLANFNGNGQYRDRAGRFDFLYFGPMIGWGWFYGEQPASTIEPATSSPAEPRRQSVWQNGICLWMGVAGVSQLGQQEPYYSDLEGDFATKSLGFDAPGIWLELQKSWLSYQSVSLDTKLGVQSGESKLFIYLGIGMGLWH